MTDGWSNVQPFNVMSFIVFPANRIGSNSDTVLNKCDCPSIGHTPPMYTVEIILFTFLLFQNGNEIDFLPDNNIWDRAHPFIMWTPPALVGVIPAASKPIYMWPQK